MKKPRKTITVPYPPTFLDAVWEIIEAYHVHSQTMGAIMGEVIPIALQHGWKGDAHHEELLKTKKTVEDAYKKLKSFNDKKAKGDGFKDTQSPKRVEIEPKAVEFLERSKKA
jgi:hypothetical protein